MSRHRLSRRRAVQLSGSLLVAGLAGCPGDPSGAETTTETGGDATTAGRTATEAASETRTATPETAETVATDTQTSGDGSPETETSETGTPAPDSPTRTPPASASVTPAVSVSDQETGGETITVESVAVDRSGWLVVHPAADGGPDAATYLAAVSVDPGRSTGLEVSLNRSLAEDRTLYAMLHYDDPDDGSFTFAPGRGDDPPVEVDGETVVESFHVTVT